MSRWENLEQAAEWTAKLHQFKTAFNAKLKARTYIKDVAFEQIPKSKHGNKKWWYTHDLHRGLRDEQQRITCDWWLYLPFFRIGPNRLLLPAMGHHHRKICVAIVSKLCRM
ncbi:hypothetical protein QPX08_03210 [Corynebacterium propinquum]|nr:hypothetical protein [Corynebacterium propinquum]MDK4238530.1 hypothetical protein [Corynebacterium propinquum]MDK4257539.1 hypothetical protein [Corynebacterium propinquum]MDK4282040.1 hypothetical protein [Corynebacterium propinquum]MDK4297928.1 hypothetical protein [Corynebacterium propinquum]MDK4319800.1 hypothetical protein [Corynebacterium propinquum]